MELFKKEYKKYLIYKELLTIAMAGEVAFALFLILCINTIKDFNLVYKVGVFAILLLISWVIVKVVLKSILQTDIDIDIDNIELDEDTSFILADAIYKIQTIFKYGIFILFMLASIPFVILIAKTPSDDTFMMILILFVAIVFLSTCCLMTFNNLVANLLDRLSRDY